VRGASVPGLRLRRRPSPSSFGASPPSGSVISIIPRGGPSALDGITPSAFEFVRRRITSARVGTCLRRGRADRAFKPLADRAEVLRLGRVQLLLQRRNFTPSGLAKIFGVMRALFRVIGQPNS
jgi:hypothetical protein